MNVKTELIALAVRLVAENTSLIRKPDAFESFLNDFIGGESYDRRVARNIEAELERATNAAKKIATDVKFKKIVARI